jgi:hypothetical protein
MELLPRGLMSPHEVAHDIVGLVEVVVVGLFDQEPVELRVFFLSSLFYLLVYVFLFEVGRVYLFNLHFGVVIHPGFERLGALGWGHAHVVEVSPFRFQHCLLIIKLIIPVLFSISHKNGAKNCNKTVSTYYWLMFE